MVDEKESGVESTKILDYSNERLVKIREQLLTNIKSDADKIKTLYGLVSSLPLGYNRNDDIPASEVFANGYGQCNTKVTLLCALARGAGIPTRIRAYKIGKNAQRRRAPAWLIFFMPKTTMFTWPELKINGKWLPLQRIVFSKKREWNSCPFDGARYQLEPLRKEWLVQDLGLWSAPDKLYEKHKPSVYGWRTIGWKLIGRRVMNRIVRNNC